MALDIRSRLRNNLGMDANNSPRSPWRDAKEQQPTHEEEVLCVGSRLEGCDGCDDIFTAIYSQTGRAWLKAEISENRRCTVTAWMAIPSKPEYFTGRGSLYWLKHGSTNVEREIVDWILNSSRRGESPMEDRERGEISKRLKSV
jgi:hypothetical protein